MPQARRSTNSGDITCPENAVSAVRNTLLMFRHVDVLSNRNAQNALRFPAMNENCGNYAFSVDVCNSFASIGLRDATPG